MNCLTCQWKLGQFSLMEEVHPGLFLCNVCKTTRASDMAAPVLRAGLSGYDSILLVGSFLLLLLGTVVWDAYPALEIPLTWTALFSMYLVYFGLAFSNLKARVHA